MSEKPTPVESFYKRNEGTIQFLTLMVVPLSVLLVGYLISFSFEQRRIEQENAKIKQESTKIAAEYLRIATGILAQDVDEGDDDTAIRTWAVDVLELYSPVPLTADQRKKLISGESKLPDYGYSDYAYGDYPKKDGGGGPKQTEQKNGHNKSR